MFKMTQKQRELLQHTLGADSRYSKKQWGFRNRFCADHDHSDYKDLMLLVYAGLMVKAKRLGQNFFFATKQGAIAIGFKPYQLRKAGLADKINNDWTLSDLNEDQRGHLAWRLDSKTCCGYLSACKIARLETPHKDMPIYELFMEMGMTEKAAKIHACKVINFRLKAA